MRNYYAIIQNLAFGLVVFTTLWGLTGPALYAQDPNEPDTTQIVFKKTDAMTAMAVINDACNSAIQISGTGTNAGAVGGDWNGLGGTCGWTTTNNSVFYTFNVISATSPNPIQITINGISCSGGPNTLKAAIYAGCSGGGGTSDPAYRGCATGTGSLTLTSNQTLAPGTYILVIDGPAGASCNWNVYGCVVPSSLPLTIGGTVNLCAGSNYSFVPDNFYSFCGVSSYSWDFPGGVPSTSTQAIPQITYNTPGTYDVTMTVTDAYGPRSQTSPGKVIVNSTPGLQVSVTNNSPICAGQNMCITITSIAGATYNWVGPNGFSSIQQNPCVMVAGVAASGNYTCTITVGGCSTVAITTVVVNPAPAAPTLTNDGPKCAGQTICMSASFVAGATYSWTGPNTYTSSLQNPCFTNATLANSGTYTGTVTVGGCTSTPSTTTVVVNPAPAAPTISSNSPVCTGQTLCFTASNIAGATYNWLGPGGFSSIQQNPCIPNVQTANAGTYSCAVTVGGCQSVVASTPVVINPVPSAPTLSNNGPVCAGQTLQLTAPTVLNATYSWIGPNSFASPLQNPTIPNFNLPSGSYAFNCTITVGTCAPVTGVTYVYINQPPSLTLSNGGPKCVGESVCFSANMILFANYDWQGPQGFSYNQQTACRSNLIIPDAGNYTCTVTVPGCAPVTATTVLVVNPTPTATVTSNSPVCTGGTLCFSANSITPGATYFWTGPNGYTSNQNQANPCITNVTTQNSGNYSFSLTLNGCNNLYVTTVVVNPTPTAPTLSNNGPICSGQTLCLSASTIPGATYQWIGPQGYTSGPNEQNPCLPNVTTFNNGVYTCVTTISGCSNPTATTTVVINNSSPAPLTNNNGPLCASNNPTINLSTPFVSGATYSWTGPNSYASSAQNPSIPNATTANAGTYSLTANVGGCISAVGTTTVVLQNAPVLNGISSNSPVCTGETLLLTGNFSGATAFSWNGPLAFTAGEAQPAVVNVTTANAGTYSVTATNGAGCITTATIDVAIRPEVPPTAQLSGTVSGACLNQPAVLTVNLTGVAPWKILVSENNGTPIWYNDIMTSPYSLTVTPTGLGTRTYAISAVLDAPDCKQGVFSGKGYVNVSGSIPTATISGTPPAICLGSGTQFTITLTGQAPWSFTYKENSGPPQTVSGITASPYTFLVTPTGTGTRTYTLLSVQGSLDCAPGTVTNIGKVTVNAPVNLTFINKIDVSCAGGNGSIYLSGANAYSLDNSDFSNTSGIFNNLTAGSYTVYGQASGCASATLNVTINSFAGPALTSLIQTPDNEQTSITASWNAFAGAQSYTLRYRPLGATNYTTINGITGTTQIINGLTSGVVYEAQVQVVCSSGAASSFSALLSVQTAGSTSIGCQPPTNVTTQVLSAVSTNVSWVTFANAKCYIVYYGLSNVNPSLWSRIMLPHLGFNVTLNNLTPNKTYGARVQSNCTLCSTSSGTRSGYTATVTFNTPSSRQSNETTSDLADVSVQIYPNPSKGVFNVRYESINTNPLSLEITDITGRSVLKKEFNPAMNTVLEESFDLSEKSAGVYLLKISDGNSSQTLKLILQ